MNPQSHDCLERSPRASRRAVACIIATAVACAAPVANRTNGLPGHLRRALSNGVSREELVEVITHLTFYAGWPSANTAVQIARQVFAERPR